MGSLSTTLSLTLLNSSALPLPFSRKCIPFPATQGAAAYAVDAFEEFGYPCPDQENPANHLMDAVTPASDMNSTNNSITPEVEKALVAKYGRPEVDLSYGSNQPIQVRAGGPFFWGDRGSSLRGQGALLRRRVRPPGGACGRCPGLWLQWL